MKNFVVMYSPFNDSLLADYEQIQGNTAIEAARKFVESKYTNVKRSGGRDANLCLLEGNYDKAANTIRYRGRHQWYACTK